MGTEGILKKICLLIVLISLITGCSTMKKVDKADNEINSKLSSGTSKEKELISNSNTDIVQNKGLLLQNQGDAAIKFIENLGFKVVVNSGVAIGIKLPKDFNYKKDSVEIGKFLYEKNQLSKKFDLDFSNYMGKSIYLLEYQMSSEGVPKGNLVMFFNEDKMVGAWIDESAEGDIKELMKNLETYSY